MIKNTFVINPVRPDFIHRCLETLYKYTDMTHNRVVVVDQTLDGLKDLQGVHLLLRPHRNLGFSKSMNEGLIHGLRWGSEYITCMNDDIEFINNDWWNGIIETFKDGDTIVAVNPMSPKEPGWGYGLPHGEYIDLLPYKREYSQEDYDWLMAGDFKQIKEEKNFPKTYPEKKVGVIDAIATWCTVFERECFERFGLWEERYYPGGGEDYDYNARVYREGYRMVGTTKSWVWHWWGSSKDKVGEYKGQGLPIVQDLCWMNPDLLWPPEKNITWKDGKYQPTSFDPWGRVTLKDGSKKPMYRVPEIEIIDI